eukprot:736623_1
MYFVYFLSLIVISVLSQDCGYSYFTYDQSTQKCMFLCQGPYDNYNVDPANFSFNFIAEECDNVGIAAQLGLCSTLSDLVWPTSCECPSCGCSAVDEININSFEFVMNKDCLNCTCVAGTAQNPGNFYQCLELNYVDAPYNWNDFACGVTCKDNISGDIRYPGDSWFEDKDVCDKFCYCTAHGVSVCEEGFAAILSSTNHALVDAFYFTHWSSIESCLYDPSRMVGAQGPSCYDCYDNCVQCDCGTHAVDEQWYLEFIPDTIPFNPTNINDPTYAYCLTCECDGNTTHCDLLDTSPYALTSSSSCPGVNKILCAEASGNDVVIDVYHDPTQCVSNAPSVWCSWSFDEAVRDDIRDPWYVWGCGKFPFCPIYGVDGECVYVHYTSPYTDCNGVTRTLSSRQYNYCCNDSDNCNAVDIDTSTCEENKPFSELMQSLLTCLTSIPDVPLFGAFGLDYCLTLTEQTTTCEVLSALSEAENDCYCKAYTQMYNDANTEWKSWMVDQVSSGALERLYFSVDIFYWNEALGCSINLDDCDVTANTMRL